MVDALPIVQALGAVMADVQAVRKDERNQQQNFHFRGIDAVVNAVGPALREHGVVVVPHLEHIDYRDVTVGQKQTPMRECQVTITYRFHGPAGDHLDARVSAEALDSGDKATAKAHSVAYRTCLLQALTIPTDEPDPHSETHERSHVASQTSDIPRASAEQRSEFHTLLGQLDASQTESLSEWMTRWFGVGTDDFASLYEANAEKVLDTIRGTVPGGGS